MTNKPKTNPLLQLIDFMPHRKTNWFKAEFQTRSANLSQERPQLTLQFHKYADTPLVCLAHSAPAS
jgi:hypothetical protein